MQGGETLNRRFKFIFYGLLVSLFFFCISIVFIINNKNNVTKKRLLSEANNITNRNELKCTNEEVIEQVVFSKDKLDEDKNVIGKLIISAINVVAPIKEGTSSEVLKDAVGHFSCSKYWNGNVCLASHNRGTYAHYFEKIDKLNIGDEIIYQTKLGTKKYKVKNVFDISEDDLSVLEDTDFDSITLITCIKNTPEKRLCVKAVSE